MQAKTESAKENTLKDLAHNYWQTISSYVMHAFNLERGVQRVAPGVNKFNLGLKGLFLGDIYEINPNPKRADKQAEFAYDIGPLLNELDQQPNGRQIYSLFSTLTDGAHPLVDTSPNASKMRRLFHSYLNDLDHIHQITQEIVNGSIGENTEPMEIIPEKFIRAIILKILMRVFFATDELPEDADETMKLLSDSTGSIALSLYPSLSFFDSKCRTAKGRYRKLCNELMDKQIDLIYEAFQSDTFNPRVKGKNLFMDLLIFEVKEKYPSFSKDEKALTRYLKNLDEQEIRHYLDSMASIPSILMLADNISKIIVKTLEKWQDLIYERFLVKSDCSTRFPDRNDLTRTELRELRHLSSLYHSALRSDLTDIRIPRYTEKQVSLKNRDTDEEVTISANSTILFKLGDAAKYQYENHSTNFSVQNHKRKCPGSRVAEVIFNAVIAEFIMGPKDLRSSYGSLDRMTLRHNGVANGQKSETGELNSLTI